MTRRYLALALTALSVAIVLYLSLRSKRSPFGHRAATELLVNVSQGFREIVKRVSPSVVRIYAEQSASRERSPSWPFPQSPFEPFAPGESQQQVSMGSGILIDEDGHVVTNYHVVQDAKSIRVGFDKDSFIAKLIGGDPMTDLAVLQVPRVPETALPAEWANSDGVEVGDWALALGSPFHLDQTVTVGMISAKGRSGRGVIGSDFLGELLQTDAAINPGNSGGPLVDLSARVVGVNTAIYTQNGGYMGIGFAIPSDLARDVTSRLLKDGKVVRGWLGATIQPVDEKLAEDLKISGGAVVHEVLAGSPAANAGLEAGDVIVEIDTKPIEGTEELRKAIASFQPGQRVALGVVSYRDRRKRSLKVRIGKMPMRRGE